MDQSATKFIHLEVIAKKKEWADLLWVLSKGDKAAYDSLKGTEVIEFFQYLKNFQEDVQRKNKEQKK